MTGERERVDLGLQHLQQGLRPFVDRTMTAARGAGWAGALRRADNERLGGDSAGGYDLADPRFLLRVINGNHSVFASVLRRPGFQLATETFQAATDHVHFTPVDARAAEQALGSMARLLELAGAHTEAEAIRRLSPPAGAAARSEAGQGARAPQDLPPFVAGIGAGGTATLGCLIGVPLLLLIPIAIVGGLLVAFGLLLNA